MNRSGELCSSAIDYSTDLPVRDTSLVDNQRLVSDCGLILPRKIDSLVLKFEVNNSSWLLDGYQLELLLSLQIVKENGDPMGALTQAAPVCGMLSCFKTLDVWSNGRLVKSYQDYHYMTHVLTTFTQERSWFDTLGTGAMFLPDTTLCEGPGWCTGGSDGATYRRSMAEQSKVFTTYGALMVPPMIQQRLLPSDNGNSWEFHLHTNDSSFIVQKDKNVTDNLVVMLHKAQLVTRKILLSPQAGSGVLSHLDRSGLRFPFRDYDIQTYTLQKSITYRNTPACSLAAHPVRVWLWFVDQDASADQTKCSFWYKNNSLKDIELTIGANTFALRDLEWDLGKNHTVPVPYYETVWRALGATAGFKYGVKDYARIASVLIWDTTNSAHSANCEELIPVPPGATSYSVSLRFQKALETNVLMMVMTETPSFMQISNSGAVALGN